MKSNAQKLKEMRAGIKKSNQDKFDSIHKPEHYAGRIECWDLIRDRLGEDGWVNYCLGNCYKYLYRHKDKGENIRDLKKLRVYLDRVIDYYENL